VLEAASVVGEEFAVVAVAAEIQGSVADVEARCEALAAQRHFLADTGVTVWPDATQGGRYRFQHALYQQVLYEQVGSARRGQLHQRIGARLEAGYGARAGEIASQLAVHLSLLMYLLGPIWAFSTLFPLQRIRRGSRGMEMGDKNGVLRAGNALLDHGQHARHIALYQCCRVKSQPGKDLAPEQPIGIYGQPLVLPGT
jgi:hypothetical protein